MGKDASAVANENTSASTSTVGLLVSGCGFLGAQRAAAAAKSARGVRLIAVEDADPARSRTIAERRGCLSAPSFEDGLNLPGVEAVVIATPHADHYEQAWRALEAGKHVLCEKPMTTDPDQARALATMADRRGLRLASGHNHRFYPPILDALRLANSGALGPIDSVRVEIGHSASSEFLSGWHGDPARSGGGTLMDNGPHACDLVRLCLGEATTAQGITIADDRLRAGAEIEAFALFRNHDRAVGEVRSSWRLAQGYLTMEVRGRDGWLRAELAPWRLIGRVRDGKRLHRRYFAERLSHRLHQTARGCDFTLVVELESFAASCRSLKPIGLAPHATGWDGARAVEMIAAVYQSAALGREIPLKPLPVLPPTESRLQTIASPSPSHSHSHSPSRSVLPSRERV